MLQFPAFSLASPLPEKEVMGISEARHQAFGYCCRDDQGRIYAAWRDGASHGVVGAGRLRMRRYDHEGAFDIGISVLAEPDPGRDLRDPMICHTPHGNLVLVWNDTPSVGTGTTYFKTKMSSDRGETWGAESTIAAIPFNYARVYGGLKVLPSTDPSCDWEVGFTAYYQTSTTPAYLLNFYISRDGGQTFSQAADIGQAPISATAHNETAFDGLNPLVWFAASRASDSIHLKWSVDGRQTWGSWQTISWTSGGVHIAPSLDIVKDSAGRPWLLLGVSDRTNDWMEWSAALIQDVLEFGVSAFPAPTRGHACSNAYPGTILYPDGNLMFTFTREYSGQPYASTHLGYFNYGSLFTQRGPLSLRASEQAVPIANDSITYTSGLMQIDTEGGAAADNLSTINGGRCGDLLILQTVAGSRDVTVRHAVGNIQLSSGSDFTLTNSMRRIILQNHGPYWVDVK